MQTLLNRLAKLEARSNDGECTCPHPPSPVPPAGMVIVARQVVSPPLRLRCPDCRQMRTVEFVHGILGPAGMGTPEQFVIG